MTKTRYVVTGTTAYAGHKPGEEFDAELTEAQEKRAIDRGSIKAVTKTAAKTKTKEGGKDG